MNHLLYSQLLVVVHGMMVPGKVFTPLRYVFIQCKAHARCYYDVKSYTTCSGLLLDSVDWTGLVWNGMDWTGLDWNGMDWSGLEWNGMDWNGLLPLSKECHGCN